MDIGSREPGIYVFESFRLDPVQRIVTCNGKKLDLTPRLFDILLYLVHNHGRVVGREELQHEVWGSRAMESNNVPVALSSLRKSLHGETNSDALIETIPGQGYRLAAAVTFEATMPRAPYSAPVGAPWAAGTEASRPPRPAWQTASFVACALVLALAASGAAIWQFASMHQRTANPSAAKFAPPPHSVAVMAFTNLSGDPTQDYFSDGISDELINALYQLGALRVVPPSSSFALKGRSMSVQDIARHLNVGTIVRGSVRRAANHVVIKAEMLDGVTGDLMWSETYDRDENQILRTQQDLAQATATALQQTLAGSDAVALMAGGTSNPKALDLYLRAGATEVASDESEEAFKQATTLFEQAIALDPNFAMAKADLSLAIYNHVSSGGGKDAVYLQRLRERAKDIAEEAVALAPTSALAHNALGFALAVTYPDFAKQEAEFARARALAPGNSRILDQYARFAIYAGHTSNGLEASERAAALSPNSASAYYVLAWNLLLARRPNDTLVALRHAQELGRVPANLVKELTGYTSLLQGEPTIAQLSCSGLDSFAAHECLAVAYHALGKPVEAAAQLAKMHDQAGDSGVFNYAEVAAQWGQSDDALHWLETAFTLCDPTLIALKTSFFLDPIRQTERFKAIEAKLDFPP